jgi:AraC-like DNA-binding protein
MPANHVTLGFILASGETTSLNGFQLDDSSLVILREGTALDYRLAPGTEWLAFQVTEESLERLGIDPSMLPKTPVSELSPLSGGLKKELKAAIAALQELESLPPTIVEPANFGKKVFASVMDGFHAVLEDGASVRVRPYPATDRRLVRQATEYIDANMSEALQIGALCSELGTNWRSLEHAFARLIGVTPKRYLQLARLSEARRLLLRSRLEGRSISDIAMSCGINHLGRFSRAYCEMFGERPSQTGRR